MANSQQVLEKSPSLESGSVGDGDQVKVLSGNKLEQLVVRLQRHSGRTKGQLNAPALNSRMDAIRLAREQHVKPTSAREMLKKSLLKSESAAVIEAYNSPDTYNLPAGNTTWRLSNAISRCRKDWGRRAQT